MRVRNQTHALALIEAEPLRWVGGFIWVVAQRSACGTRDG
jgi:hypothetical protein